MFTCDIIICPEVHFYVVPLENHATLCGWSSNRHVDVILVTERVDRQRLCVQGLMQDEICKTGSAFNQQPEVKLCHKSLQLVGSEPVRHESLTRGNALVVQAVHVVEALVLQVLRCGTQDIGYCGVGGLQPRHEPFYSAVALERITSQVSVRQESMQLKS